MCSYANIAEGFCETPTVPSLPARLPLAELPGQSVSHMAPRVISQMHILMIATAQRPTFWTDSQLTPGPSRDWYHEGRADIMATNKIHTRVR